MPIIAWDFGGPQPVGFDVLDEDIRASNRPENPRDFAELSALAGLSVSETMQLYTEYVLQAQVQNFSYTGVPEAAHFVENFTILPKNMVIPPELGGGGGLERFYYGSGIMLSTGDYFGPLNSSETQSRDWGTPGDPDLSATLSQVYGGDVQTFDAAVIEFEIEIDNPAVTQLRASVVFGSEEFPIFINDFVDIAAFYVNGQNHALFPSTGLPLSVLEQNFLADNFFNNANGNGPDPRTNVTPVDVENAPYLIEWNGFTPEISIRAPLQQGLNTIKIAIADTGDPAVDSGLFIADMELVGVSGPVGISTVRRAGDDGRISLSSVREEVILDEEATTVTGDAAHYHESTIYNFGAQHQLVIEDIELDESNYQVRSGSVLMDVDSNNDGEFDVTFSFADLDDPSALQVQAIDGNTVITFIATDFAVEGSIVGLDGAAISADTVQFIPEDTEITPIDLATDGTGFSGVVQAGLSGRIEASRANNNGEAERPTVFDALEVLRLAVGLEPSFGPATPEAFVAADMDGNGQIDVFDALEVLRAAVGLESANGPRWVFVDADTLADDMDRTSVDYQTGIDIADMTGDITGMQLTGILTGHMSEFG